MYGMVNKAIREYIETSFGKPAWQQIKAEAGFDAPEFISMDQYPDDVSVSLVVAASQATGRTVPALLEAIGEYWIGFAMRSDYGHLLQMAGDTLPEILMNLDNMHTRIGQSFTELQPPSFWCTDVTDESLTLHYVSSRGGLLAPMVAGLVRGLGKMLSVHCTVEQTAVYGEGDGHDEFHVTFAPAESAGASTSPAYHRA
ncbi:MAG: heme NO-binding domain-containing protein [Rhodothermales bacterium]